jgi:hypothetical protein
MPARDELEKLLQGVKVTLLCFLNLPYSCRVSLVVASCPKLLLVHESKRGWLKFPFYPNQ